MKFFPACLFLLVATPLCGCLWDRDTIAMEAQGRLEVVETMVGWFDRFLAEYYQMRLDRVTRELGSAPERLDLYDDAGVACDRLGRHEEAVGWMEKKQARMQTLPPEQTQDHRYRLHANLGVFRTHQWLKSTDRSLHGEKLDLAIEEVRAALKINPNAHFGRERAHLALLDWWQAGLGTPVPLRASGMGSGLERIHTGLNSHPELEPNPSPHELSDYFLEYPESFTSNGNANLVKGFCGLIQMGSAQDSLDVHALVAWHLMHDKTSKGGRNIHHTLGYLACLRLGELMLEGRQPVYAGKDFNRWLNPETYLQTAKAEMTDPVKVDWFAYELNHGLSDLEGSLQLQTIPPWFHQTRAAAQRRLVAKTAFMQQRFAKGMHPDTHLDFWQGWEEPVMPVMPAVPHTRMERWFGVSMAVWLGNTVRISQLLFAALFIGLVLAIYVAVLLRRRRRARMTSVTSSQKMP